MKEKTHTHSILQKSILLVLLLFFKVICFGQKIILSENSSVSVLTCDTGNESYSLFGHTAIRIIDTANNLDAVFNYGAFDFATPNFVAKFSKGDLDYFATANSFSEFMAQYYYEQRSVYEQELKIPLVSKQELLDSLTLMLATNQSTYAYRFIDKNCTSMVVDLLNKTLKNEVITNNNNSGSTYRSILFPYFDNFFFEQLGTSILFGTKVDQLSDHIFLPFELLTCIKHSKFKNKLLCSETKILLEFKKQPPKLWWNSIYTYLLFLVIVIAVHKKYVQTTYFLIVGVLGIVFTFMGFYSLHGELSYNYNILLFNPLLLFLIYFNFKKNAKWTSIIALFCLLILGIYLVIMLNKAHFWLMLPLITTTAILLLKIQFDSKKAS
jgi:hypothetical protein